jgi:hypothetical protein
VIEKKNGFQCNQGHQREKSLENEKEILSTPIADCGWINICLI